jgi:hypothetical protein
LPGRDEIAKRRIGAPSKTTSVITQPTAREILSDRS